MSNSIPTPAPYIQAFEQLGFGMFVHFGLYSQLKAGEWIFHHAENMPMSEYEKLFDNFNPGSMANIVNTAKNAGCKYICLTTRHHDGFSLYDTRGLNDYDAPHSPCGRDLIHEFVDECRKADIVPFFYHTTLDWRHPDFENNFDAYLDYLYKSVEILCTQYGKIGGMWFDGNWSKPDANWREDELYGMIRRNQPDAMIVNNTGLSARGMLGASEIDAVTFERGAPEPMDRTGHKKYVAGEMCQTLCDHWGIADDINFKPVKQLVEEICECRKAGANMLLNIGPNADGTVPKIQEGIMECIGYWMSMYGEAIYNGRPYIAYKDRRDFILKDVNDPKTYYLFCFDLNMSGSVDVHLGNQSEKNNVFDRFTKEVESVNWMDTNENLTFRQDDDKLTIDLTYYQYGHSHCVRIAKITTK